MTLDKFRRGLIELLGCDPDRESWDLSELDVDDIITAAEARGRVNAASLLDQWALVAEFTLEARVLREAATKLRTK